MREERLVNSVLKRASSTTLNGDIQLPKFDPDYWKEYDGTPWDWVEEHPAFTNLFRYVKNAKVNKSGMHHIVRLDDKETEEESIDLYISENHEEIQVNYNKRGKKIPVVAFKLQMDCTDISKNNVSVVKIDRNGFPDYNNGQQIPASTGIMDTNGFNDFIWWKQIKYGRKIRDFLFDLLWRVRLEGYLEPEQASNEEISRIVRCLNTPGPLEIEEVMPQYSMENFNVEELTRSKEAPYSVFNFSGVFYVPKEMNEQEFCEALQKSVNVRKWKINGTAFQLLQIKANPAVEETSNEEVVNG